MQIDTISLRNYRVYEHLDLEIPPGVVGVYGPNGSGKSTLLESILWALFGRARTGKGEIRTSGVLDDCSVEVSFEHEGHRYAVRRAITGVNATVKASALCNGLQVAEGVRDTARYVRSILGMDDAAFRASVFAEQKQLAAFSDHAPDERRRLVLQLLGITPLDKARDAARKDARARRDEHERLRAVLPSLVDLEARVVEADRLDAERHAAATAAAAREAETATVAADAEAVVAGLAEVAKRHEALMAAGTTVRAERDNAARRVDELQAELATLTGAEARLRELADAADDALLAAARARLAAVEGVDRAERELAAVPPPGDPPADPDPLVDAAETARAEAEAAAGAHAGVAGRLAAAQEERTRAADALARSSDLSADADCPLCGQELGEGFASVVSHRQDELAAIDARIAALAADAKARQKQVAATAAAAKEAVAAAETARKAKAAWEVTARRYAEATARVTTARAGLDPPPGPDEAVALQAEVTRRADAVAEAARLAGRLERRDAAAAELEAERRRLAEADARRTALLDQVRELAFDPDALQAATAVAAAARSAREVAAQQSRDAAVAAATARAVAESAGKRLAEVQAQHTHLEELAEEAKHLMRMSELMSSFRNSVIGTVGPQLSAQAAELFAELTDREYEALTVDPETYEIQISDGGRPFGMSRFSGSETDLANLALRVAISEHIRFQTGGQIGLLVLDEVLASLDADRRGRMLLALTRLANRFRQVLVVTHAAEVKEQLPNAIEVVKLPGRRATARTLDPW